MTKEEISQAYARWYYRQQEQSGCGGPVLMACVVLAVVLYVLL